MITIIRENVIENIANFENRLLCKWLIHDKSGPERYVFGREKESEKEVIVCGLSLDRRQHWNHKLIHYFLSI